MRYTIHSKNPASHFIDIEAVFDNPGLDELYIQLPAWRPGRYELGNFAKNIQKFSVCDERGETLMFGKVSKDKWKVRCSGAQEVRVVYNYYADFINAGSTYVDELQLYMNPVNCLVYIEGHDNEACEIVLEIPENYEVATGMNSTGKNRFKTASFDELADCPFMASGAIQHHEFTEGGTLFHLWFQGECKPDFEQLEKDFRAFTIPQISMMGGFPVDEYHYLFQIFTHRGYHGVEHSNSTVISIGPSWDIFKKDGWYNELLGVSSHELFHTWNVKRIRPADWWPYDFSGEDYSRMGYLAEGFTTYYGDLFLFRGGVFSDKTYLGELSKMLNRHFRNPGRKNLSVADSSFDTWLDGYEKGIPGRKTSIYNEGALCAFMMDVAIRKATGSEQSLDDVVRTFYNECYLEGAGVSEEKFIEVVSAYGREPASIIEHFVYGTGDYEETLIEAFALLGIEMKKKPSTKWEEANLGLILEISGSTVKVAAVMPDSPAEKAGLAVDARIISINNVPVDEHLSHWFEYFADAPVTLSVKDPFGEIRSISISPVSKSVQIFEYYLEKGENPDNEAKRAYEGWASGQH